MLLLLFVGIFFLAGWNTCHAQTTINREYRIKAAYLFNFGRYTQWPEGYWQDEKAPFAIGILGSNPFHDSLAQIANEKELHGRKIAIYYFRNLKEYQPCQILYISESIPLEQQKVIIASLANTKVLLIGEEHAFLKEGGMVCFFLEANKVRFGVNLDPIDRNDLKISSKVLKLAAIVKKEEENN